MSLITVIGRGHSGTRAISQTLYASGVYMGRLLNPSGDKMPPQEMYDACKVLAKHVKWDGDLSWDFSNLHTCDIDPEWDRLIESYLADVLKNKAPHKGWKIPEAPTISRYASIPSGSGSGSPRRRWTAMATERAFNFSFCTRTPSRSNITALIIALLL